MLLRIVTFVLAIAAVSILLDYIKGDFLDLSDLIISVLFIGIYFAVSFTFLYINDLYKNVLKLREELSELKTKIS